MLTKSLTLTEQVAGRLADDIAAGVYPVGGKLPTGKALAQLYGVSAAVIREATERLRAQGLVESRQGAGCTVVSRTANPGFQVPGRATLDRAQLASVYELRMELEGGAAALAALRRSDADLAKMAGCLAHLENHLSHADDQGVEQDIGFHAAIAVATQNTYYQQLLQYLNLQVRAAVRMAREHTLQHQAYLVGDVHQEHVAVYEAIAARDPQRAREAAVLHLQRAATRLRLDFSSFDPTPTP
ncbi:FadR/GntR family transcriptional regulator [Bordetella sp. BOR01]|uniref:FadR/GntR family transcriptional regulator n=1 Tax=Bordetella sp. BOR01 TaxID=2854779 RepID=UPI001C48D06B|nr:FCD domain-containing protein [Bordetella sp. BOR01]MBV7482874.1 FCD domain-containing protein [Bordetella sp. BOR01]